MWLGAFPRLRRLTHMVRLFGRCLLQRSLPIFVEGLMTQGAIGGTTMTWTSAESMLTESEYAELSEYREAEFGESVGEWAAPSRRVLPARLVGVVSPDRSPAHRAVLPVGDRPGHRHHHRHSAMPPGDRVRRAAHRVPEPEHPAAHHRRRPRRQDHQHRTIQLTPAGPRSGRSNNARRRSRHRSVTASRLSAMLWCWLDLQPPPFRLGVRDRPLDSLLGANRTVHRSVRNARRTTNNAAPTRPRAIDIPHNDVLTPGGHRPTAPSAAQSGGDPGMVAN